MIRNPWAGQGFVDNLAAAIQDCAPELGALPTEMVLEAASCQNSSRGFTALFRLWALAPSMSRGILWALVWKYAIRHQSENADLSGVITHWPELTLKPVR
ncbi:hypothetical protein [Octadecabacter dasysiphoniae]|uniref:hypothetical protein n=1 Tax=Octadecabacter dasysiphoniae TaxID=2909341 RepID=UPI00300D49DA